ncbi:glycine zipper family protein [Paenibacillus massiliensis]|uniref:glycine zipper family protein n=1 Tax=Paenibacillus massiliensis TaxID=225917 RepID=UPI0004173AA5|nr:glycine zipper family protein [Paenibacillus massiliensis]
MRKLLVLICIFTILFQGWGSTVWAEEDDAGGTSGIIGKQMDEYYSNPDNNPGLMERSISDVLIGSANFLIQSFGMRDVTLLVFGKNPNPTSDGFLQGGSTGSEFLYLGVFTEGMMNAIEALYSTFERMMPFPVVIAVLLIAVLMLFQSMSSESRSKGKDYVTAFLVGLLSIRFGHYLWSFVSYISTKFTELVWATMIDYGIQPDLFLNMIWGNGAEGYGEMIEYRGFVVGVLVLLAAIMTAMLNYQYTLRTIMLMILVSTFVVAAILTIFPKFRHSLQTWWDLFISYMLMPCAHAVALGLFFLLLRFSPDGVSNWVIVAYLFGFSAIQGLVSKLWGDSESKQRSGMGAMLGIGSMMALGRMFRPNGGSKRGGKQKSQQTVQPEEDGQQMQEAPSGSAAPSGGAVSIPGRTATGGSAASGSWKQKAVKTGGRVAGLALNYGSKMAGATAGASIGMMAGNPIMGAAIGAKVGGWAGKGAEGIAKGGVWLGSKAFGGMQNMWANQSANSPSESMLEEGMTMESEGVEQSSSLIAFHTRSEGARAAISAGSQGELQPPIRPTGIGASRLSETLATLNGADNGEAVGKGSSDTAVKSKKAVINSGIIISGGDVQANKILATNTSRDSESSNSENYNSGIWISGGNVKAKSIESKGDSSGQGVRITGGHVEADRITPNTDLRKTGRSQPESTHETPNAPSPAGSPLGSSDRGSSSTTEKPFTPSNSRHYNYDL